MLERADVDVVANDRVHLAYADTIIVPPSTHNLRDQIFNV
jgi:hypothetical protein